MSHKIVRFALRSLWLFTSITSVLAQPYSVTDLGNLGGSPTQAAAINNNGQVVGTSFTGQAFGGSGGFDGYPLSNAFLWTNGTMVNLGLTPGVCAMNSVGLGLNNNGQAVGYSWFPQGFCPDYPFLNAAGTTTALAGGMSGVAFGINNSGQIVGSAGPGFLYSNGTVTYLSTFGGRGTATAINDTGQIVGVNYFPGNAIYHAFLYSSGSIQDLGTLGGTWSVALGLNNAGVVVGYAYTASGAQHGFLYSGSGPMQDLGTLGGSGSQADAINASGQIVGWANTASGAQDAFLVNGVRMVDLNPLVSLPSGVSLVEATGINDTGQIVANGSDGHAYLLTPPTGTITVTTNLSTALFTITGPATYLGGGISATETNVPAGTYQIVFAPVSGYTTPAAQTFTISPLSSLGVEAFYNIPFGTLNITTNLPGAIISVTGPASLTGLAPLTAAVPPGQYTISLGAVTGYLTPSNQTVPLAAGQTLQVSMSYSLAPIPGTINIQIKPPTVPNPQYSVVGPSSFSGTGSYAYSHQPPGTYTITFTPVVSPGFSTPPPQTQTLTGGGQITFTGSYSSQPTLLSLTQSYDANSPRPLLMQISYAGERTSTAVTATITISSYFNTWYELDFDPSAGPSPQIPSALMNTVIGPNPDGRVTLPTITFGPGTVLRFTYSRSTPAALGMLAIDMICRGIFGQSFPANGAGVDLEVATLGAVLSAEEAGVVGEASAIPLCEGDIPCIAGHVESILLDILTNKQVLAAVGPIITQVFGPQAMTLITSDTVADIISLFNVPANLYAVAQLAQGTFPAPLSGYLTVTAH